MTKLVSQLTGTTNVVVNVITVVTLSFIAFTLIAACLQAFGDLTLLNRAF